MNEFWLEYLKIDHVYGIKKYKLIPLFIKPENTDGSHHIKNFESKFSKLWSFFSQKENFSSRLEQDLLLSFQEVDLTKWYYWSYTYNLSLSLQKNNALSTLDHILKLDSSILDNFSVKNVLDDRYLWNAFLREPFINALGDKTNKKIFINNCPWLIHLIHGSFNQQRFSTLSKILTLTLIGRRSRFYAGTRYNKRGINNEGDIANDVEVEQILHKDQIQSNQYNIYSFVQVRGSIPTFWSQDPGVSTPRPPIKKDRYDPFHSATRKHFSNLVERYGDKIAVLNLIKQEETNPRETPLGNDFRRAIQYLNSALISSNGIYYHEVDFSLLSKTNLDNLLKCLKSFSSFAIGIMGFYGTKTSSISKTSVGQIHVNWLKHMKVTPSKGLTMFSKKTQNNSIALMRWSISNACFIPIGKNIKLNSSQKN